MNRAEKWKGALRSFNKALTLPKENLLQQLKRVMKTSGRHEDFVTVLSKQTGLSKAKIHRVVNRKDFRLLNVYHSSILIVSQ